MIDRYSRKEMKNIWEEYNKYSLWLDIELAAAEAMEKLKIIPKGVVKKVKAGMIFTIEPMINIGNYETKTLNDGWTAVTKDKSLSAQFEHTIGVTKEGYEIFTQSNKINSN